ncbi:hypothetical protein ACFL07_12840, partial [Pseudomonadota bacterium]
DAIIHGRIWQEYNMVSMTNRSFLNMLENAAHIMSQVFVFKKSESISHDQLITVIRACEKALKRSARC